MGIIIRQSIKSTIFSYIGIVFGIANTLFLLPKFFSIEQIGLLRLLQDIPFLLGSFIQLGAANVADRFFPYFKTDDNKNNGFLFFLIIYALFGFVLFILFFTVFNEFLLSIFQDKSPMLVYYFYLIVPLAFFQMYSSIFEAYCRVHCRIVVPTIVREIIQRFLFSLLILLFAFKFVTLTLFLYLFVATYFISVILLIIYSFYLKILYLIPCWSVFSSNLVKQIFSYVGFIIPGTAGSLVISKIDTIFIGASKGLANTGVYSVGFFIGAVIEIPKRAVAQISTPILVQAWQNNDIDTIADIYKKSSINQLFAGVVLFLCVWCCVDELLYIIPNHEIFMQGKYVILFIGLGKIFDMMTGVNSEIILYSKYFKFNLMAMLLLSAMTIVLNILLIPNLGINGAAISFALSLFIFNMLKLIFIWFKFGIQPFSIGTVKIILLSISIVLIFKFFIFSPSSLFLALAIIFLKCIVITSSVLVICYHMNISSDLNSLYQQTIILLKKKLRVFP